MSRRSVLLALLPFAMTACFGVTDRHSVLVKQVPANLAFGNPPATSAGLNPEAAPGIRYIQLPAVLANSIPQSFFSYPVFNIPSGTPLGPCPDIQPGVFPADPQTTDIEHQPTAGTYTVRGNSTVKLNLPTGGGPSLARKDPVLPRIIHDVKDAASAANTGAFTYAEEGAFGLQVIDPKMAAGFTVRPSASDAVQVQHPPGPPPVPPPAPQPPNTQQGTAPADGVFLTSLKITWAGSTFTFSNPVGVQLMQVPAFNGLQWNSTAQDPADQTAISFNGGINPMGDPQQTGVEDINACGEPVRTYKVTGTLVMTGAGFLINDSVTFNVVTQYGGWIVADTHILNNGQFGAGVLNDLTGSNLNTTLNHLTPGNLPAGVHK